MSAGSRNHPFYGWVPRPVGILVLLLMFFPPTFSGGAYLCNVSEMSGGLGVWAEDIQMASFFTSIGMCLFPPLMLRFMQARRIKNTFLWCFTALIPLNYVCAVATSVPLLLAACLLTGFVRVIAMLNCTFTIAQYLTGMDTLAMFTATGTPTAEEQYAVERKRTFMMPVLYSFILVIAQLCNMMMAWFAYEYRWQDTYYVVMAMQLVALLLVVCTMADEKKTRSYKVEWEKIPGMLLMAFILCCLSYVLVYGKTLDWFDSGSIRVAFGVMLLSCGLFLLQAFRTGENGYLPLKSFAYRNVAMSMLLFLLSIVFNSANAFVGSFAKLSTPADNVDTAFLGEWAIAGCLLGLVVSIFMVVRKTRFRTIFFLAFMLMAAANALLYFQYQTMGLFDNMAVPTLLNYTGLLMLYSVVAAFGMKSLPPHYLATFVFLMIWMRNAIAPVVGSSIYSNWLNDRQQYHIARLAQNVDNENSLAAAAFAGTMRMAQATGKGTLEAGQLSTASLKGKVTVQATIVAMKEITGETVLLLSGAAVLVLLLPYHKNETT